ncbi:helix-turn-helix domain-containing protein [Streptacidiphilus sp. PAMC 29251]
MDDGADSAQQRRIPPVEMGPMLGRARMRAGLRGRECARLLGIPPGYLVGLETGQRCPSLTIAERIAGILALDETELGILLSGSITDAGPDHAGRDHAERGHPARRAA